MTTETQPQNAVSTRQETPTLVKALNDLKPEIAKVLPSHLSGDRFARIVLTEVRKNPKLATTDPNSFFGALLTAATLGLEPGVNGECYLVPYKNECQLIVGYMGMVKLFWQHPLAKRINAEIVYEKDTFAYSKGLNMRLEHEPHKGTDRGKIVGYYAIVELNTGAIIFDFFTPEEIKALRGGREGSSGGVADPQKWLERKTAIRQVLKLAPKSAQLEKALNVDETIGSMAVGKAIATGDGLPELEYAEAADG